MKIIPAASRLGDVGSAAERRVVGLLAQVDIGEPATAFYSVHLPRHEYKRMAEIDFLLVLKGLMVVVEVKGGRISRRDGFWRFQNRYGETNEKREGPFQQARTAMFALERGLEQRVHGLTSAFGCVVVTPDQELARDLEWDAAEHIGPHEMTVSAFEVALTRTVRYWRSKVHPAPSGRDYEDVLAVLRPDFDRVPRLSITASNLEHDYVALAREQYDMLRGAEMNQRILIMGGAGSGKTLLAIETAQRAAAEGRSVLLTCKSLHVVDLMRRSDLHASVTCVPYRESQRLAPHDVLVVDEAQDLMNLDDMVILDSLVDGGLTRGTWRMFCDPNNQAHVDGSFQDTVFAELRSAATVYALPYNCRNTAPIVTQTQLITGADVGVPRVGHGPPVEYRKATSKSDTVALLDAELKRLRQEEIPATEVVVISLAEVPQDSAAFSTKAFSQHRLCRGNDAGPDSVRLVTPSEFKGLEAPHVLVVDVDDLSTPKQKASLYVAMTRPRVSLWMAVGEVAWRQMAGEG